MAIEEEEEEEEERGTAGYVSPVPPRWDYSLHAQFTVFVHDEGIIIS